MDTIELWARNGDAVREAMELGDLVHLETSREELTDAFLLLAIESGLLSRWAASFPDPRNESEIGMEVILASQVAARHRLGEAIHTAFGKPGLISQWPNTLGAVIEKKLENAMAFIPKSHVGQSSKGGLTFVQHSTVLDYMTDNKLSRFQWIPYFPFRLSAQSIQEGLGVLQIGRVKPLGEPAIDRGQ